MKKIIRLVASLTIIAAVCAGMLAFVDSITKDAIEQIKVEQKQAAVKAVMPDGVVSLKEENGIYIGKNKSDEIIGFAAEGKDAGGYGGDIVLMVGFEADRKTLVAYKTLAAAETPGLGMKLNDDDFSRQFKGKDGNLLKVDKDGGQIESITAATITSRAVCKAIADAAGKIAGK